MKNKYNYLLVIQQNCGSYGWEDVSEYAVNSSYLGGDYDLWKHDVKEYRLTGYATRTIRRREINESVVVNQCDHGHDTNGTVKRLPIGEDSAVIVCHFHYENEIRFRRERNKELSESCKFELPTWESLEVYTVE